MRFPSWPRALEHRFRPATVPATPGVLKVVLTADTTKFTEALDRVAVAVADLDCCQCRPPGARYEACTCHWTYRSDALTANLVATSTPSRGQVVGGVTDRCPAAPHPTQWSGP